MLTLNQLKYKLIDFFNNHAQIKSVKYEDDFDFNAEKNLTYPVCNMEYLESTIANKVTTHRYKFVLCDLANDNVEGIEDEIYSDMLLIAEDFFTWADMQYDMMISKSTNIQKFTDDTHDRVSGAVFRVDISLFRSQNECAIPKS